jgi:UDP-2,3-diacylglucosamine hydrolase
MLLFISDAHIGIGPPEEQQQRKQNLFDCLDHHAPELEKLLILGDLFDFWFEWRHVILKKHFQVLYKLRELTDAGVELHYLAGNHDFALSEFLRSEIGAQTHLNEYEFETGGKTFYLLHGDGLAPADWGYRILKRVFRSAFNQKLFRILHPDMGLDLAHTSSHTSRNYSRRRWDIDGWAYEDAAREQLVNGSDYVVFAHNHEPILKPLGQGIYVNTGDWIKYFSYATFGKDGMALKYWDLPFLTRSEKDYT